MDKLMIFVLLCCSVGFLQCNAENSEKKRGYVFSMPYKLPIGGNTTGCISLQNAEPPAYITTELLHQNEVISTASYNLTTGSKACLKLNVPMIKTTDAKIRLTIKFAKYPDDIVYDERKVEITQNSRLMLIETDKKIYKPGEEVNVRIVHFYQDFTPVLEPISIVQLKNPMNNVVMEWESVHMKSGMGQWKFRLSPDVKLGRWYIWAKMYPNVEVYHRAHIEVRTEGVLNFELNIVPPTYVLADAAKLTWKICARYNYDVPAIGTLVTKLVPYAPNATNSFEELVKKIVVNSPDGCTEVVTSGEILSLNRWSNLATEIVLTANFTEYETGITLGDVSRTPILYEAIKLKFAPTMPRYFKLDVPYQGKLIVLKPDNTPVPNEIIQLCLHTTGNYDFARHVQECRNFTSSSDGSFDFIIPPQHRNTTSLTIVATAVNYPMRHYFKPDHWKNFMNQPSTQINLYPSYSESNSYVVVIRGNERPVCGKSYTFNVIYTLNEYSETGDPIIFHYSVNSRSGILLDEYKAHQADVNAELHYSEFNNLLGVLKVSPNRYDLDPLVYKFQITIEITPAMAPMSELLVYYVRSNGQIVSASHMIDVGYCYNNDVSAEWSTSVVQNQGSSVRFNVKAAPDSLCGISIAKKTPPLLGLTDNFINSLVVFESAKGNNPITAEGITLQSDCKYFTDHQDEEFSDNRVDVSNNGPIHYVNEMQAFSDFGALVMTNMKQSTQSCSQSFTKKLADKDAHLLDLSIKNRVDEISLLKSHFPDIWVWDMQLVKNTSIITSEYRVPDQRANWASHAVCISPKHGLGVAPPGLLQVHRPFSFECDFPPVMKVDEIVDVKARLHNYMDRKIPVAVQTKIHGLSVSRSLMNVSFCIQPRDTVNYRYIIEPRKVGTFNIIVDVSIDRKNPEICEGSGIPDSRIEVTKPITVLGEGYKTEDTTTELLCSRNDSSVLQHTFDVTFPDDIIKDSVEGKISIVGNLLGLTSNNVKEIVKMPTGGGEQNVAKILSNIFTIQYLDSLRTKNVKILRNKIKDLEEVYQTQFNYRLGDGSYGTFEDSKSSIWLTASVVKAFALARKYIYVPESGLQQSVNWLVKQQSSDGCFPIIGSLIHKDMKSDLETDDSLTTVFVLISLLESKLEVPSATIKNAMNCIERSKLYYYNIPYTKIMTTYALTLMQHPFAKAAVKDMLRVAKNENGVMWWEDAERKSLTSSIEMTSYMVLAMAQLGDQNMNDASMAVRWLTKHKNSLGGFVSTHDSALASQATTAYALFGGRPTTQLSVLVITDDLDRPCKLDKENSLIPEYVDLPKTPSSVDVSVHGDGCAVAQVNVKYSMLPRPSQSFDLSVSVNPIVPEKCDILELQACTRYKEPDGYTNMAIMEIAMLSGYVPVRDSLDHLLTLREIQRYEVKENELHLYFEKLVKEVTCVSLKIRKQIEVYNFKPSNVKVYDYYRPELNAVAAYTINRGCNNTEPLDKNVKLSIYMLIEDTLGTVATYNGKIKDSERT